MKAPARTILLLLAVLALTAMLSGCKTPDNLDNETSRPWNAPRSWETGLPGFQNERR